MSDFEKYLSDYLNNFLKDWEKKYDKSKDTDYGKDCDKNKGKPDDKGPKHDDKKKPDDKGPDILNIIAVFLAFILNILVEQKSRNIVLANGNNNTIQIPNESGPGSNIQL